MGCNCKGKRKREQNEKRDKQGEDRPTDPNSRRRSFELHSTDGSVHTFERKLDAEAQRARYGGTIRVV